MRSRLALFGLWVMVGMAVGACESPPAATSNPSGTVAPASTSSRLNTVLERQQLVCGVSGELPGFSFVTPDGNYAGLDVDICRAIAAAVLDDPNAIEFRNLNAKERFTAVQTGEVDVLSRNTTLTLSRSTSVGLTFAPIVFYDGQGIMVRKASGIKSLDQLKNASICMQTGTTHEQNLTDQTRKRGIKYQPVVFEDVNTMFSAYAEGRCPIVTADRSALTSRRTTLSRPDDHQVLDILLSKEPLAPAVVAGDDRWAKVVQWVIYSLIEAEELGITSQNLDQFTNSKDPEIRRFLGLEGDLGKGLGLTNDFAMRVIKQVGNYGEIYDRSLGDKTPLKLSRGQNNLWSKGGLLYSPPFR